MINFYAKNMYTKLIGCSFKKALLKRIDQKWEKIRGSTLPHTSTVKIGQIKRSRDCGFHFRLKHL